MASGSAPREGRHASGAATGAVPRHGARRSRGQLRGVAWGAHGHGPRGRPQAHPHRRPRCIAAGGRRLWPPRPPSHRAHPRRGAARGAHLDRHTLARRRHPRPATERQLGGAARAGPHLAPRPGPRPRPRHPAPRREARQRAVRPGPEPVGPRRLRHRPAHALRAQRHPRAGHPLVHVARADHRATRPPAALVRPVQPRLHAVAPRHRSPPVRRLHA